MSGIFQPCDILLPRGDMQKWSVVACDQFTSDAAYWERVRQFVGDAASTLNLILPEVYLGDKNRAERVEAIAKASADYLNGGIFDKYDDSYVLVRRTFADGTRRLGLVGVIDLEAYDFTGKPSPVRASEETVPDRLPPRIEVRRRLSVETSHVMALIDDAGRRVIEPLAGLNLPVLYDFEMMEGGGHCIGYHVTGETAERAAREIEALPGAAKIIIGDGNHSLAAAKRIWEELKPSVSPQARMSHPARFALAELSNVYDEGIEFHAIHRAVFGADNGVLTRELAARLSGGGEYSVGLLTPDSETEIRAAAVPVGTIIAEIQAYLDSLADGIRVDYIHGGEELRVLVSETGAAGILLPAMNKADLFETIRARGVFPRKSFSIGEARGKRYYIECRGLTI